MRDGFYVELHAWEEGSPSFPGGVSDVTQYVSDVDWSFSTTPPWGGLQAVLVIPFRNIREVLPGKRVPTQPVSPSGPEIDRGRAVTSAPRFGQVPEAGFWVVIGQRDMQDRKRAFGLFRCAGLSYGISTTSDGGIVTTPVTLTCETFLGYLAKSQLKFAPHGGGQPWGEEGFVYDIDSWQSGLSQLIGSVLDKRLGPLFSGLWSTLVRTSLPPSLGGSFSVLDVLAQGKLPDGVNALGAQIPIVFDSTTAATLAPLRTKQMLEVFGLQLNVAGAIIPNQNLLDFFMALFSGDPRLVELFPSVEYNPDIVNDDVSSTHLGKALGGSQPVIIYRLRPWLVKAINSANVSQETGRQVFGKTASERAGLFQTPTSKDPAIDVQWFEFRADSAPVVSFAESDYDRVNMLSSRTPFTSDSGPSTYGLPATPLVRDREQVHRHGLRPAELSWPYTPNEQASSPTGVDLQGASTADIKDYSDAISELGWAYCAESERFVRGSVSVYYRPWVTAGHWCRVYFADSCLTAYIESVTHGQHVDADGHITRSTSFAYSRGTLRYYDGLFREPEFQLPLLTAGVNAPGNPAQLVLSFIQGFVQNVKQVAQHAWAVLTDKSAYSNMVSDSGQKQFNIYLNPGKTILPGGTGPDGKVHNGAVTRSKKPRYIVIHQSDTTAVKGMITQFGKIQSQKNNKGLVEYYYKGTNYSVDKDGSIIEWADPDIYYTNNSTGKTDQSIGIDFILVNGQQPTTQQVRAGAELLARLTTKYSIPLTVAPDRASEQDPHLTDQEMLKYGIYRHRSFAKRWTACCGAIDVEAMVHYLTLDSSISLKDIQGPAVGTFVASKVK